VGVSKKPQSVRKDGDLEDRIGKAWPGDCGKNGGTGEPGKRGKGLEEDQGLGYQKGGQPKIRKKTVRGPFYTIKRESAGKQEFPFTDPDGLMHSRKMCQARVAKSNKMTLIVPNKNKKKNNKHTRHTVNVSGGGRGGGRTTNRRPERTGKEEKNSSF